MIATYCLCHHPSAEPGRTDIVIQAVDDLLAVLGASGGESVPVPSWQYSTADTDGAADAMTLRDALIQCYDVR